MNLISYRGPGMAGGLSAGLTDAWDQYADTTNEWWHIADNSIAVSTDTLSKPKLTVSLDPKLIDDHYRYCHELIWPIMHDLPNYATYNADDHRQYRQFNSRFADCIVQEVASQNDDGYFIHDYQLALLAATLRSQLDAKLAIFWHIPWPKTIDPEFVPAIKEIAYGLLQCNFVGFHAYEYAHNFLRFIEQQFQNYRCEWETLACIPKRTALAAALVGQSNRVPNLTMPQHLQPTWRQDCRLVVAPLGIDFDRWKSLASIQQRTNAHLNHTEQPIVLSVDRTDYTKGIYERLKAIDQFFNDFPHWLGKVTFIQICGRTRTGVAPFDSYWNACQYLATNLKKRWGNENWQPIVWVEQSLTAAELASFYREATVMLVTPIRDGLNLTAKEYIACQGSVPGVLALSSGAGSWQELGKGTYSLSVDPEDALQMSRTIQTALIMKHQERAFRMELLKQRVKRNSLDMWWHQFTNLLDAGTAESTPLLQHKSSSA